MDTNYTNTRYPYDSQNPLEKLRQEMRLRKFSPKTIKSYLYYTTYLLNFARKGPTDINQSDIRAYLENLCDSNSSSSTLNTAYSALRFYFEKILRRKFFFNIPRAKKDKKLPIVLSKKEILDIINACANIKHKLLISLSYGSRLRVSEAVKIKALDINIDELTIHIKEAKNKKDRITVFPEKLKDDLERILSFKNANDYLFESERGGRLTERTAQKIFENSLKKQPLKSQRLFIPLDIHLPPIYWKTESIYATYKCFWDTPISAPPKYIQK